MAAMKSARQLVIGLVSASCIALVGCSGKTKEEKELKVGKFIILDEVQTDGGDRSLAKKNAENTLVKYPEIDAMVGLWAYNAPQCLEALKDSDKLGKVKVFSFDEDPVTLDAIKDGTCEGTIVQDPYRYGYESIRVLAALARGDRSVLPATGFLDIPARQIRRDNVAEFWADLTAKLAGDIRE